ncbi:MAG: hypothetical protein CBE26_01935 [Kiritimatiellaceae bacterium TMED266]|jgi:putative flippase GtrA|nr:MAG: hypothetical protein CBE26_01935 [Kiritimatiellaceae bacterium TMED266]
MTSSPHSPELLKYFSVVVCGYLVDIAIFILLIESGWSIYLANCAGFVVGSIFNVILIRLYVFSDSRFELLHDLGYSLISNTLILFVGLAMLWLLVEQFNRTAIVAKVTANGLTFFINFIIRKQLFSR